VHLWLGLLTLDTSAQVKGTEGYIAPEVLAGEGANSAADMWAVGVMLHKAMFRSDPAVEAADDDGLGRVPIPPHDNEALRQVC
jgi:serine/threonine protein kinase